MICVDCGQEVVYNSGPHSRSIFGTAANGGLWGVGKGGIVGDFACPDWISSMPQKVHVAIEAPPERLDDPEVVEQWLRA